MRVETVVADYLASDSGLSALIFGRVYQLRLPQKPTLPAVRVQLIDEPAFAHLRGGLQVYRSRVQVDAFADEFAGDDPYATANAVADAVDAALRPLPFSAAGSPALDVLAAYREHRMPLYDPDELRIVRIMQDYIVWSRTV